jgi:translation initiation factor 5B
MAPKSKPDAKKTVPSGIAKLKAHLEAQKKAEEEQRRLEEEQRRREEEELRLAEEQRKYEEAERERQKEAIKEQHKAKKQDSKRTQQLEMLLQMKKAGMQIPMTPELEQFEKEFEQRERDKNKPEKEVQKEVQKKIETTIENHTNQETREYENEKDNSLRAPVSCFLGHVDAGKSSLIDKIMKTNLQQKEANNITQQINTYFLPKSYLISLLNGFDKKMNINVKIEGAIISDSPGHEAFANLRNRGSSICDIAVLVVDIMHGLENQTRESIRLLKQKKCPFVVAMNKVDRLYGWVVHENMDIQQCLSLQHDFVLAEFEMRLNNIKLQLSEEGFNTELYFKNPDPKRYVSIIPTSAKTGEGLVDLILTKIKLVQQFMESKISYKDELQCTVMELKPVQGYGMTMDVILVNGVLHTGDTVILSGINGPIVTRIRYLLTPQPMRELRVKGEYENHSSIKAAHCIKVVADGLEDVVAGTQLYVADIENKEEIEKYKQESLKEIESITNNISIAKDKIGVAVQSSTLGSLEALLSFLEQMKIPVGCISLGPVYKKHMVHSTMMKKKAPKYACLLAFDVEITPDAKLLAEKEGVKIFDAKVIYHLFDSFTKHVQEYDKMIKEKNKEYAVFPVVLQVLCCFRAKDPLVIGCRILDGQLRIGTPLCVREKDGMKIGKVIGLQVNNKDVQIGKKGMDLAVKLEGKTIIKERKSENGKIVETERDQLINYGRQFGENTILSSAISRKSIDALKESFRDEMEQDDWKLVIELKKEQNIS